MKWAAPGGAGANWSLLNSGGTALTGAQTITVSGISGADKIMVLVKNASAGGSSEIALRLNGDTGSNYNAFGDQKQTITPYAINSIWLDWAVTDSFYYFGNQGGATGTMSGYALISGANSSGVKVITSAAGVSPANTQFAWSSAGGGFYSGSSTISSISICSTIGNLDAGTVFVYTSA